MPSFRACDPTGTVAGTFSMHLGTLIFPGTTRGLPSQRCDVGHDTVHYSQVHRSFESTTNPRSWRGQWRHMSPHSDTLLFSAITFARSGFDMVDSLTGLLIPKRVNFGQTWHGHLSISKTVQCKPCSQSRTRTSNSPHAIVDSRNTRAL